MTDYRTNGHHAMRYATLGWPVLPLNWPKFITRDGGDVFDRCSCYRATMGEKCDKPGKHPMYSKELLPNGKLSASTERDKIEAWWREWPHANVGICAGKRSGFFVVDVDPRNGGDDTLRDLIAEYGELPVTLSATTGSGGKHYLFKYPDFPFKDGADKLGRGLDTKGDGGYIVAENSTHPAGGRYRWDNWGTEIAQAPEWLLDLLRVAATNRVPCAATVGALRAGGRNSTLFTIGCQWQRTGMSDEHILYGLLELNEKECHPPLSTKEVQSIATNLCRRYDKEFNLTDLGNAERLVYLHGDDIAYCDELGGWHTYDGARWVLDKESRADLYCGHVARKILQYAYAIDDEDKRKAMTRWGNASESQRSQSAMLSMAKRFRSVRTDIFDTDPWKLNCLNGVVDLRSGELLSHDKGDMFRKVCPVEYDADLQCPNWMGFLRKIFLDDEAMVKYAQRIVGYTLTGDVSKQCMFFLYGGGANGKSTFIETLAEMMGDYQAKFPNRLLIAGRFDNDAGAASPDVASLQGVRLAHASEIERGSRMAEAKLKDLTGGDTVVARFLHKDFFSFKPTHKLWIYGNDKPDIRGRDEGIWRRINLIPFLYTFTDDEKVAHFKEKYLLPELAGIMAWAVQGCLEWQANNCNFDTPEQVLGATAEYRKDMDRLASFISEKCMVGRDYYKARSTPLYQAYVKWCEANYEKPMSMREFGGEMSRNFKSSRDKHGSLYYGVGLVEEDSAVAHECTD